MGELVGWPYWKVISITGQSGAGTDYQVELEIGDSAGGDFHLEGHCTNFPQDIRITDDDGTTLLDHWVEDLTADPIIVHVEVKDDLGSNKDVRVYYGKNGETTASNGDNTFLLHLDFENTLDGFSGGVSTTDQFKFGSYSLNLNSGTRTRTTLNPDKPFATMQWIRPATTTSAEIYQMRNIPGTNGAYLGTSHGFSGYWVYYDGGWQTTGVAQLVQWNKIETVHYDATYDIWINDVEAITGASYTIAASPSGFSYNGSTVYIDGIIHRKYNSPEPAFSSAGAEQTPTVGVIMNQFQRANIGADLYNGVFA